MTRVEECDTGQPESAITKVTGTPTSAPTTILSFGAETADLQRNWLFVRFPLRRNKARRVYGVFDDITRSTQCYY